MSAATDVLIVGMGPVGAALAGLLGDLGVTAVVLEREPQVYPLPRAAHFDHEIMRLFQNLGVADAVLEHCRELPDYEFRAADGSLLVKFPAARGNAPSGWKPGYMFHQPGLEHALRAKVAALPAVEVRIGARYLGHTEDADGVVADVEGPGGRETIRAKYLVGCDGASSAVRGALGVGLDDYGFDEPWLVIDVRVTPESRLPTVNLQVCDPARPTTCVLMGPGRHRWEFMLLPGETAEQVMADGFIEPLLAKWDCGVIEIERRAVYRFHGLVAKSWREGRVLLAGDAAHQTPPFAGQGMCAGLRDAANLAWKLAAVLRGADDALLDTYQSEREPHARAYIELAIGMGRVVCTLDPEQAALRDAGMKSGAMAPPAPVTPRLGPGCFADPQAGGTMFPQPRADGRGLDDVLGQGAWLVARTPAPVADGVTVASTADARLAGFAPALTAWLDQAGVDAVLVRPDRYVFGAGAADDLLKAWAAVA